MKRQKTFTYAIAAIILSLLIIFPMGMAGGGARASAAAESYSITTFSDNVMKYEQSNVWDDLQSATFDGEPLDLDIYNYDSTKRPQLISFIEFGYSENAATQNDFNLYVYVYNPAATDFTKNEELNCIQFRYASDAHYEKYPLKYLNRSTGTKEGLFYKFKIVLTEEQRNDLLLTVPSRQRTYEVSGIELYRNGRNAIEYDVSNIFKYTGYAKGYRLDTSAESTLACACEGLDLTLNLDVHLASYCPGESNGKDANTRDVLHTAYFSVPTKILDEYGGLYSVRAMWKSARTVPMYVTPTDEVYDELSVVAQQYNGYAPESLVYCLLSDAGKVFIPDWPLPTEYYKGYYGFNTSHAWQSILLPDKSLDRLPIVFNSGWGSRYTVNGEDVLEYMLNYSKKHPGTKVNGKYNRNLFSSVDSKFTVADVTADDTRTLKSAKIGRSFWEKMFGGSHVEGVTRFDEIDALHEVTAEEMSNAKESSDDSSLLAGADVDYKYNGIFNLSDIINTSKYYTKLSQKLYISGPDVKDFVKFYNTATAKNETVFLFRYRTSEYESHPVTEFKSGWYSNEIISEDGYFAQEDIDLDFDVIDLTCRKNDVETIIAAVSSPQDFAPDVIPPVDADKDNNEWFANCNSGFANCNNGFANCSGCSCSSPIPWWGWLLIVLAAPIIVALFLKLIRLPFKALSSHREQRQSKPQKKKQKKPAKNKRGKK